MLILALCVDLQQPRRISRLLGFSAHAQAGQDVGLHVATYSGEWL